MCIGSVADPKDAVPIPDVTVVFEVMLSEIENTTSESFCLPTHTRPGSKVIVGLVVFDVTLKVIAALAADFERGT